MRNVLLLFTTTIFLLVGISNLEAQDRKGKKGECKESCKCEKTSAEKAETVTLKLTETLKLDDEQSEKVEAIYLSLFKEQEAYSNKNKKGEGPKKGKKGKRGKKGNKDKKKGELSDKCVERNKALAAKLSKVFTDEQIAEYEVIKEDRRCVRGDEPRRLKGKR